MFLSQKEEEKKYDDEEIDKENESQYLYFELLKLVDNESNKQLDALEKSINVLADEIKMIGIN